MTLHWCAYYAAIIKKFGCHFHRPRQAAYLDKSDR